MDSVTGDKTKLDLLDINYKRAAINIAQTIIDKINAVTIRESLAKELDSALYNYSELNKNYLRERNAIDVKTSDN